MGIVRKRKVILYARVSSNTQKDDLINQVTAVMGLSLKYRPVIKAKSNNCCK